MSLSPTTSRIKARIRQYVPTLGLAVLQMILCGALVAQPSEQTKSDSSPLLVFYDFEKAHASGPDTFRLFQRPSGRVDLSSSFRISGERSLRLAEGSRDGSFSEFLGFFPEQATGKVFVQFYLLLTDPAETFNFALAGSKWFLAFERHGHALWLQTRDGKLRHRVGDAWHELFEPQPFAWYFVDLVYDVDAGTYDLALYEEGIKEPLVNLFEQTNVAQARASSIRYYSFIGDLEDEDDAMIFVDDLLVAVDPASRVEPFVAPGRRHFFVESLSVAARPATDEERDDVIFEARSLLRSSVDLQALSSRQTLQLELAADLAFGARDLELAEEIYSLLQSRPEHARRALLKLSDVYFLKGERQLERQARERIYGRLDLAEVRARAQDRPLL